jgi:hypothetical protein
VFIALADGRDALENHHRRRTLGEFARPFQMSAGAAVLSSQ